MTVTLPGGGTLLAFTDGLVERKGESIDEGLERLREVARTGGGTLDDLLSRVLDELIPTASDDTAILGLRWQT